MPQQELHIEPGILTEETDRGAKNRWKDGDHVRFRTGLPEKIGGWTSTDLDMFGVCRAIFDWSSLDGEKWAAFGTNQRLYVFNNGNLYNITPIRDTDNLTDPFHTTTSSRYVYVDDTSHGLFTGDVVNYSGGDPIGGLDLDGDFVVVSDETVDDEGIWNTATNPTDADHYYIDAGALASSTAGPDGGTVAYIYEINSGDTQPTTLTGYGTGGYGEDVDNTIPPSPGYGTARAASATHLVVSPRIWSLDNWGEDLIASPLDGPIYVWDRSNGTGTRAQLIPNAPSTNKRVLVSQEDRHLISLGANDGSNPDPMLIRWSDTEDYNNWTPDITTNTAGDKRLDTGSGLITGVKSRNEIILFTDEALYSMQFIGGVDVFSFRPLGKSVSIAGPNSAIEVNGVVIFMGLDDFYKYDGVIAVLPCEVRTHVFTNAFDPLDTLRGFNRAQSASVYASINRVFTEIWWVYPAANSETNNRYVVFNYGENVWYYGTIDRSAFHDQSNVFGKPYATTHDGEIIIHESGYNDEDEALDAFIESWDADTAGAGQKHMHIDRIVPDFKRLNGSVDLYLKSRTFPQDPVQNIKGPFNITSTTKKVSVRDRNKQIAIRVESDEVDDDWRMGTLVINVIPHGERE